MAFNGLYIPGSDLKLREAVTSYVKKLVPVDASHRSLSIETESGKLHSIECSVKLWYCVPSVMEEDFLIRMQHTSTSIQGSQGKLTGHTIIHLISSFLGHFHRTVTSKLLKYLYYPGDSSKGVEATLCGIPMDPDGSYKNPFREILINNSLCDSDSWKDMAKKIESYKKNFDWKDETVFSNVYIAIWMENFTKVAYETLKDLIRKFPEFTKIDGPLKLGLIPEMSLSQFQRMFQQHVRGLGYTKEGSLDSFRLDLHQLPIKDPIVLSVFKGRDKLNIYHGDPYRKPTGGMILSGDKVQNFPPSLLEFLLLLMYAHFSEDSFNSISKLSQPPSYPQVMTTNDQEKDLARRYLRCVIFTISASQASSAKYWQQGYFPRDKSSAGVLVNKMHKTTQMLFLTMSAISDTCSFFQKIGINPMLPELTKPIHDWVLENDLKQYEKIVQDPVFMYTCLFCYQVHIQEPISLTKEDSCRVLDVWVRCSTGRKEITTFTNHRKKQDEWIGNYTSGGSSTLSMSPDPEKLKQMCDRKGYLLEVLGDDMYSQPEPTQQTSLTLRPITHRISQFASWRVDYPSFFEFLVSTLEKATSRATDTNVSTSTAQAPAAPQDSENDGSLQKLSSIGNDAAGGPTSETSPALAPSAPQGEEGEGSSQKLSSSGNEPTVPASSTSPVQASAVSQCVENERALQRPSSSGNEQIAPPASTSPSQVATDSQVVQDAGEGESSVEHPSRGNDATAGSALGTSPAHTATDSQGVEKSRIEEFLKNTFSNANDAIADSTSETLLAQAETGPQGVKVAGEGAQSDIQSDSLKRKRSPTTKAETDVASRVKKQRTLGFEYISKTIAKIVPKVIDLTNSGDDDDVVMKEKIIGLKEDDKNKCLHVFFKYLKSNRTKLQVQKGTENSKLTDEGTGNDDIVPSDEAREDSSESKKKKKKKKMKRCPLIDDEAICTDGNVSSDEESEDTDKANQSSFGSWLDNKSFSEDYLADHRLVGRDSTVEGTEAPGNIGPSTLSCGKQLYPRSRGKIFPPPNPAPFIGGFKTLRLPQGDSSSDFSSEKEFEDGGGSDNQSHAEEGKTPEDEEEDAEEDKEEDLEENKEDADEDTLSKNSIKANDTNTSSDGEPSESTGKADDVVPDSADNIGTDSHGEDFIHDQNVNFDLGHLGGEDDLLESSNNVDDKSVGISNMPCYMSTFLVDSSVPNSFLNSNIGDSSLGDPFLDSDDADSPVPRRTSARKKPSKR
jgi:hypothetical protein